MANKKTFGNINTNKAETGTATGEVITTIERGNSDRQQQGTASPQEQRERASKLKTQGRKGCKAVRINMAISPENYEYIKIMSQITGKSMTEFCNIMFEAYRKQHPETFEKAKAILDELGIDD